MKKLFNKHYFFYTAALLIFIISVIHVNIIFAPINQFFQFCDKTDLLYFINIRQYYFDTIKEGLFPLWTTKIFCGIPFLANSETAIFYLPNLIFFILPITKAINLSFLLHFFFLSFSMFLWINNKTKNKFIAIIVAMISVFNSNYYLHFYAAHLSNIITVSWFPLLFYFYDKTFEKKSYSYIFPISFILSLQIFAGHFQYVYYTALISLFYILLFCRNKYVFITILYSYLFAILLTAIQLFPSYDFYLEGARKANIFDTENIAIFSKFKYLLTLFFHQNILFTSDMYWETSNYIGTLNIFVVLISLLHVRSKNIFKILFLILLFYSLTFENVFSLMQHVIPCLSWFRSPVKIIFFINIFLMLLLAYGIQFILYDKRKINIFFICLLLLFSLLILNYNNFFSNLIIPTNFYKKDLGNLIFSFKIPAIFFLFFSILLYFKKHLISKAILIILLIIEPIIVMKSYSKPFIYENNYSYSYILNKYFNEQPRFHSYNRYNLKYNTENIVGRGPDKLRNFLTFDLMFDEELSSNNIKSLLRLKYMVDDNSGFVKEVPVKTLNRINVFYDYVVIENKKAIYEILNNDEFNVFDIAILEEEPSFKHQAEGKYEINILSFNENSIDFECNTTEPAIIMYTDNYAKGWKAYNIENPKEKYKIICADYIYKAISVDKGNHKIRFEYKPISFIVGKWISMISWIIFFFSIFLYHMNIKLKKQNTII